MKSKIFRANHLDHRELERKINEWLVKEDISAHNVMFVTQSDDSGNLIITIWYAI